MVKRVRAVKLVINRISLRSQTKVYRVATRITSLFAVAIVIALALAACKGGGASGAKDVAATVNGKNIMLSEIDNAIKQQTQGQEASLSPLDLANARLQVLDNMIKQEVLFQRAEKEKLTPSDDEVNNEINSQKQQAGSQEAFQKALQQAGQTEQAYRDDVRKRLAIQKLLERYGNKIDAPSDKEIEEFYNSNRERYVNARGVELSAIIVDPRDNGATNDAKSDIDVQTKINSIYQRLKSGGDFATIAREQSEDANTVRGGGDIGFFSEDDLKRAGFPQDLISKFFGNEMQVGDITPPTKGSDGRVSIFKLTNRRLQSENLTLDNPEVRKDASDNIINQRKQLVNAALLEVAVREAKVENKLAESMLTGANSLSSLRPAGAAQPNNTPATSASPTASGSPATMATPGHAPNTNAQPASRPANTNNARPAANTNAAPATRAANTNR
jgi:peptidyl-prolyl cis-trans isomerase SurA